MTEPDDLFTLKNQLWVGNYRNAISEGSMLNHLSESLRIERDVYVHRARLGLGEFQQVQSSISDSPSTPVALSAIKLLATYLLNKKEAFEIIDLTLKEWLSDPRCCDNPHLLLVAGQIYSQEGKISDALSVLTRGGTLEHKLYIVHAYLSMDRVDLAHRQVQEMRKVEEDSTLTQIAQGWTLSMKGGEIADEATLSFQELSDRFGATPLLLNGAAVAFMALQNYQEAERLLLEALDKNPKEQDTLINLIVASTHLQKPYHTYLSQLQHIAPSNTWLQNYMRLEETYTETAATFV